MNASMHPRRTLFILYMLTLFLVGLGYLAIMPVFEGFDEYAHYSSIRQIAATKTIPVLGSSFIDQAYLDYAGPLPYGHEAPPFDSGLTYKKFFERPALVSLYQQTYRDQPFSIPFHPSKQPNWQAQHPPLYYLLMAGVDDAASSYSMVVQIFILRLVSFLLALIGVGLGFLAIENAEQEKTSTLGFLLYPIMLPMFFPEFTRIGNDALCVLLIGALAYFLSLWRRDENNSKASLAIGVTLGLGLLTKAFFVPITAGLMLFLSFRLWRDKENIAARPRRILTMLWMIYPALFIGGGWYLYTATHFGAISGVDAAQLAQQGGMIKGLHEHFSSHNAIIGVISAFSSFVWAGTWSSVALPFRFRISLFILVLAVFAACLSSLRQKKITDFAWLPVWVFTGFLAGLFYHLLIGLALDGRGQTPAWYLHILMPLMAPMVGIGVCRLVHNRFTKPVTIAALIYAFVFQIIALWSQFALFTGCATKTDSVRYAFPTHAFCLDQSSVLLNRLSVIGMPLFALAGFGGGLICALLLVMKMRKTFLSSQKSP